ncbi:MAG: polymer-forming cytoskeletal protein [Gemmatimonadota bacterium]
MNSRRVYGAPRKVGFAVLACLLAAGCGAGDIADGSVLLRPSGDLLAAGETVDRAESVVGDVMLAGRTVAFTGDVGGSYLGAGAQQEIHGRIDGSGRIAGGTVRFGSSVGRNVTLAGGTVELLEESVVERNAYMAGGTLDIDGTVRGDLYAGGEEVVLDGTVEGDVRIEAGRLTVGPSARIGGDLTYRVGDEGASISDGADIVGQVEVLPPREDGDSTSIAMYIVRLVMFIVCGGVLVALLPGSAAQLVEAVQSHPAPALGFGLLWLIGVPTVALVAAITVVGLPLAMILAAAYLASLYAAPAIPAMWLGDALLSPRGASDREIRLKSFLVGGPLVGLAVLLPWIGFVARLAAWLLGLGAMALLIGTNLRHASQGGER